MLRLLAVGIFAPLISACGPSSTAGSSATAVADRTISIATDDQLRFVPAVLSVHPGETVTFEVTNSGHVPHEFVLGDAATQAQHEQAMQHPAGGMQMAPEANVVEVKAAQTATLTYTFGASGKLLYGCHVSGHYAAGMQGTISIG